MSWRDEVRRGAFRGIPLDIADLSLTGGKRLVVDEYPEQDEHTVDELGIKARRFRIGAVLSGDDYLDTRERLIAALERPGPGELLHPWRGRLQVNAGEWEIVHDGHNACSVVWDCVIAASAVAPIVTADAQVETENAAAAVVAAAGAVSDEATARRDALPTYYRTQINSALAAFGAWWSEPIGDTFFALTGTETGEEQLSLLFATVDDVRLLLAMVRGYPLGSPRYTLVAAETPSERAAGAVLEDFWRGLRAGILARACEVADAIEYASANAAESNLSAVADAIADEIAETADADLFDALVALRATFVAGLSRIADQLPLVVPITITAPTPAIVLAFDLYEDVTRDAEIVAQNNIGNPLFVSGPLVVLSE